MTRSGQMEAEPDESVFAVFARLAEASSLLCLHVIINYYIGS